LSIIHTSLNTVQRHTTRFRNALRLMLAPYVIGAMILVFLPGVVTFGLAFAEYDGFNPPRFNGLANFQFLETYFEFQIAVANTVWLVAFGVVIRLLAALGFALLLRHRRRGVAVYRAVAYLPTIIPDVAYVLIWLWIFNPIYGPIGTFAQALGGQPIVWFQSDTAPLAVLIILGFQFGEGMVILLAGLHDIPDDVYACAAVDGATRWQAFRFVTLPLLRPWIILLAMRDMILLAQNNFSAVFNLTRGGPRRATWFVPQMVYEESFERFRVGLSAATMLLVFIALGVVLGVIFRFLRGWGYADEI
jgi:multiple sugar transport system permease protein